MYWCKMGSSVWGKMGTSPILPLGAYSALTMSKYSLTGGCAIVMETASTLFAHTTPFEHIAPRVVVLLGARPH